MTFASCSTSYSIYIPHLYLGCSVQRSGQLPPASLQGEWQRRRSKSSSFVRLSCTPAFTFFITHNTKLNKRNSMTSYFFSTVLLIFRIVLYCTVVLNLQNIFISAFRIMNAFEEEKNLFKTKYF